jgi:SAM-dependent methyltransferase
MESTPKGSQPYGLNGMIPIAEFYDPRLVAIYDTVNDYPSGAQPDFYLDLALDIGATTVIDLGCGTGIITCALARAGYRVTGVEPSPAMLAVARSRPGAERVRWVEGDASHLGSPGADLVIMSGHVVQFILTDDSWHEVLLALQRALRPGGYLGFESRNPGAREWEHWTRQASRFVDDPLAGRIECWTEHHGVEHDVVSFTSHRQLQSTGEDLVSAGRLRFRPVEDLATSLAKTGFELERLYGDWDRRPADSTARELIVVARSGPGRSVGQVSS